MKNTHKYLGFFFLVFVSSSVFSQSFGIKGGLNFSKISMKNKDGNLSGKFCSAPGFHLGPFYEIPLSYSFSLETALLFNTRGYRFTEDKTALDQRINYDHYVNLSYLDFPVNFKARYSFDYFSIYASTGPYLGIGLFGKEKEGPTLDDEREKDVREIIWGDKTGDDFKRYDYGIQLGTGVEFGQFSIGANYSFGLANISPDKTNGLKVNNRLLNVSLAYSIIN